MKGSLEIHSRRSARAHHSTLSVGLDVHKETITTRGPSRLTGSGCSRGQDGFTMIHVELHHRRSPVSQNCSAPAGAGLAVTARYNLEMRNVTFVALLKRPCKTKTCGRRSYALLHSGGFGRHKLTAVAAEICYTSACIFSTFLSAVDWIQRGGIRNSVSVSYPRIPRSLS
jgi:hypothetical protein